jgi:hypothetical protein
MAAQIHAEVLAEVSEAERDAGWLARCEDHGRHLSVTTELADAVADQLRAYGATNVLEVCAGRGELAACLDQRGIHTTATDAAPSDARHVVQLTAADALARFQPRAVMGCFVPVDSNIDALVLASGSVEIYLVIHARLNGQFGSTHLWSAEGCQAVPLPQVTQWLITRHDVWLSETQRLLQHGEAWLFQRRRKQT